MRFMTGMFLMIITNVLIMATFGLSMTILSAVFGIQIESYYGMLFMFSLFFGFGGAFFSLLLSKKIAKWTMGVKMIDPKTTDHTQRWLIETVNNCARKAGLSKMPEVGIFESPDMNAFATGPSRKNSMVALSSGLLHKMGKDELHGVIGHEVAHIANGDMVNMTLIQGVVNTFVIFLSRIVANILSGFVDERWQHMAYFALAILFDILFGILGSVVVNYYSRSREFRADYGGAKLAGKEQMLAGLRRLAQEFPEKNEKQKAFASLQINGRHKGGLAALFMTHPPVAERIRALERRPIS